MRFARGESGFADYFTVLVRRRWVIYLCVTATTLIALIGSFLTTPKYRATVTLQIERQSPDILPGRDVSGLDHSWAAYSDFYQTQYRILASPAVAARAVRQLGLDSHPLFTPTESKPSLMDRIRSLFPSRGSSEPLDPVDVAAGMLLAGLEVSPVRNSQLVLVSHVGPDAVLAAKTANAVADAYITHTIDSMFSTNRNATDFLLNQIGQLRGELATHEVELQEYGEAHGIVSIDDASNVTLQALRDIAQRLTQAQTVRAEREAEYEAVREADPDSMSAVLNSAHLARLRAEYASLEADYMEKSQQFKMDWPGMQTLKSKLDQAALRLDIEINKIAAQVRANANAAYLKALNEEERLSALLMERQTDAQTLKSNASEYANLLSVVEGKRATLDRLIRRHNELSLAARLKHSDSTTTNTNIRIQDPARTPAAPFQPNTRLNVLLGIVFGLMLGVGLAHGLDYLDNTVKSATDIKQLTELPLLAAIPHHGKAPQRLSRVRRSQDSPEGGENFDLVTHWDGRATVSEAYRELRTALLLSHAGQPPAQIVVTSGMPREGKSATTMNLATVLAQLGRQVLVVDTDLRRPRLHLALSLQNSRGVSTYLSGLEDDAPSLLQETAVANLFVAPSGPVPPNPSELLNSPRFTQMGRELLSHGFDHIIYDSPPVLSVPDAVIISSTVDSSILVVRAHQTPRHSVTLAVERLTQATGGTAGLVLNDVDVESRGRYYSRYYGQRHDEPGDKAIEPDKRAGGAA